MQLCIPKSSLNKDNFSASRSRSSLQQKLMISFYFLVVVVYDKWLAKIKVLGIFDTKFQIFFNFLCLRSLH